MSCTNGENKAGRFRRAAARAGTPTETTTRGDPRVGTEQEQRWERTNHTEKRSHRALYGYRGAGPDRRICCRGYLSQERAGLADEYKSEFETETSRCYGCAAGDRREPGHLGGGWHRGSE